MSGNNLESGLHKLKEEGGNALKKIGNCVFLYFFLRFFFFIVNFIYYLNMYVPFRLFSQARGFTVAVINIITGENDLQYYHNTKSVKTTVTDGELLTKLTIT